jgi:hypothetical protein
LGRGRGRGKRGWKGRGAGRYGKYVYESRTNLDSNAQGWVWKRGSDDHPTEKMEGETHFENKKAKRKREEFIESNKTNDGKETTSVGFLQFGWKKQNE